MKEIVRIDYGLGIVIRLVKQSIAGNVNASTEVINSWKSFNNAKSQLKDDTQIKSFLQENIKENQKKDFAQYLDELPAAEKPTGNNEKDKINNFLNQKKAEVVIKAVFGYKLKKEENFVNGTETAMENDKDAAGQPLDESIYPKKDGKYTKEAMIKYLFEEKVGQNHQFAAQKQEQGGNTSEKGHWDKYKHWYLIGGLLLLVVGLVVIFWDKLTGVLVVGEKGED